MGEKLTEGWAWPLGANKAHYFTPGRRSLCGKWAYFGDLSPADDGVQFDCAECTKRLAGRQALDQNGGEHGG